MHNGSSTRKYRVPRSLLYSSAILSLTAAAVYVASAFDVAAAKNLFKQQQLEQPKACSIS